VNDPGIWENYVGAVFEQVFNAFATTNLPAQANYTPNKLKFVGPNGGTIPDATGTATMVSPQGEETLIPEGVFFEVTTTASITYWSKKGQQIRRQMAILSEIPLPPHWWGPIENIVTPWDTNVSWTISFLQASIDNIGVNQIVAAYQLIGDKMFVVFGSDVGGQFVPAGMSLIPVLLDNFFSPW
jgi:hypothetical protein